MSRNREPGRQEPPDSKSNSTTFNSISRNSISRSRGAPRPSFAWNLDALMKEGAGNAGCPMHPQPGVRILELSMHTSIHSGSTGITRHPPRNGFTTYSALFPGTTALLTPSSARRVGVLANLTPASGRQNHTASSSAPARSSHAPLRPPHPAPRT